MPKDNSIQRVLIIGSGPIVIGQACEFDYSGTQACNALREEGIGVVLLNSNPATIMTDPEVADRTYLEPINADFVEKILDLEQRRLTPVDAILPTMGGQTGLNCAMDVVKAGLLDRFGVRLIGADPATIRRAEDREEFKHTVRAVGVEVAKSVTVNNYEEAVAALQQVPLPVVIRPAYTLGGTGGGAARTREQFDYLVRDGLMHSPISQVLIEEDLTGWKEFELEMMRDRRDNVVVVCSIENLDPMGVHTGDSITVAPALTLTDKEYQRMRDAAIAIMRAVGVTTGGANIQFAVSPRDGRMVAIEMNPRVSRSSALASKATGFPIARIAAKLAIGYTLDELRNEITKKTPACFEPAIDYCVVKMPRFAFEKFPDADETLTTSMKSVGEAMAIGRTFKEAFQKCIRSMEIKRPGFGLHANDLWLSAKRRDAMASQTTNGQPHLAASLQSEPPADTQERSSKGWPVSEDVLTEKIGTPCQGRLYYVRYALHQGWSIQRLHELSGIDPWFLEQMAELVEFENQLMQIDLSRTPPTNEAKSLYLVAKENGYSDVQLRAAWNASLETMALLRRELDHPAYKLVDTCAAEFEAFTPYYYSTHEQPVARMVDAKTIEKVFDDELRKSDKKKVIILGGGPNRIGQGIEFDYCCVHAATTARALGYESVIINSNPETVSTDFNISDMLFFEPLTHEDVLNICERLNGRAFVDAASSQKPPGGDVLGVVVQFGGQTPLNLAQGLADAGVPILGTSPQDIHLAEDRERFQQVLEELGLRQPPNGIAFSREEALQVADNVGYPVLVRPSYVLGGRGMRVCNNTADLQRYIDEALSATDRDVMIDARHPILVDKFLVDAIEIDVDAISDYRAAENSIRSGGTERCDICGIMEHIEEAGIHSGDSSCVLPPYSLSPSVIDEIKYQVKLLARRLNVCGLMNVQFAIQGRTLYVLEVNPRASRTIPFVSKATGTPWARIATKVMLGQSLDEALATQGLHEVLMPLHVSVKAPVFPFRKFRNIDFVLGPEMRSTGEVMGIDQNYPTAFAKAMLSAGTRLPTSGRVLISVNDADKPRIVSIARDLHEMGFEIYSTIRTHAALAAKGIPSNVVSKHDGAGHPFLRDMIREGQLDLLINTPIRTGSASEEGRWRVISVQRGIPLITTLAGARAAVDAIRALRGNTLAVRALQDYHRIARDSQRRY